MENMKLLFLDIETDSLDINKAIPKFIGCMNAKGNHKIFNTSIETKKNINDYLKQFDKIITFNGENYDVPILDRFGIIVEYWKHIDLFDVFKKRAVLLRSGGFKSYKLVNIAKEIGIKDYSKREIDFSIFQKDIWTSKELSEIKTYLLQDLELTRQLWEFLVEKFEPFGEMISNKDRENFKHITSSTGAYAYKVICNKLNLQEEYEDIEGNDYYEGAYIMKPKKEMANNVLYLDFVSLYPMLYIHSNLFSYNCKCCKQEEKWHGNNMFKIDGYYCSKQLGKIESLIKNFFLKRKQYKKDKDNREFAIKTILNSLYGISAKPSFKHVYSPTTASDCAGLARQCIKYAINRLNEARFNVIYADTDSCFIELEDKDKKICIDLAKEISKELSSNMPFPWEEFDFKLEEHLDYIQFFTDKLGELKKKNYIYITNKGDMVIKGLDIIKKDCSELGLYIFEKHLKDEILKNKNCKFSKEYIDNLIKININKNKNILSKRFNIRDEKEYKSKTSIYNMIRETYGSGEIYLIKNYKIGVGKGIKYCSLDEAKKLDISDLNLEDVYKELSPFIIDYKKDKNPRKKEQKTLFEDGK